MKPIYVAIILVTALVAVNTFSSGAQTPEQIYQTGLLKEEGEGNLQNAISLFKQVADNSKADKSIQAKALLHIGMCYEKLGNQEAVKAYQRVVNNYPEQKNEVGIARERLTGLINKAEPSKEIGIRQVWAGPGVNGYGSVTANGNYLTFVDWETGNLAMRNLKTNENKQVTSDATWLDSIQYVENSLISPDGKQVVYIWYYKMLNYQLRLIKVGSQKPTVLYSCIKNDYIIPGIWYSNGEKVLAQIYNSATRIWQLVSINTSSKAVEVIKEMGPRAYFNANLSLSKDEKTIAYDYPNPQDKGMRNINLLTIESKTESKLVEHPSNDLLIGWLPDRNELLFTSDRNGTIDLWVINTEAGKSPAIPKRILANTGEIDPMGFTESGSLFFSLLTTNFESFIVPSDPVKGSADMNTRIPLTGQLYNVNWMPDGKSLICVQSLVGTDKQRRNKLSFIDLNTRNSRILADNLLILGQCRISPDGKSVLAFARDIEKQSDLNYKGGIYNIDITTGSAIEIKVNQDASQSFSLEWSQDGKSIYYISNFNLIKHNLETSEEKVIYNDKRFYNPSLVRSPDGTGLLANVVISFNDNMFQLLTIPDDGSQVRLLCTYRATGNIRFNIISTSSDGKYIYFSSLAPGVKSILSRIPAAGGAVENIWQSPYYFLAGISIHPVGNQIAISTFETAEEIRVIENLGNEVSKILSRNE